MHISKYLISLTSLGLLSSCDPGVFDKLADSTWVHSGAKPSDLSSGGYGTGLIGASTGSGDLHYIITATEPAAFVLAKFDKAGNRSTVVGEVRQTIAAEGLNELATPAVVASDPAGFSNSDVGNVAIAVKANSSTLFMVRGENGEVTAPISLGGDKAATGIAFGASDASSATDLFAIAGKSLNVISDYAAGTSSVNCDLSGEGTGVLVADVDVTAESEVLFAVDGTVFVMTATAIISVITDGDSNNDCIGAGVQPNITAPSGEASFGTIMRSADFAGDGVIDLVISAPAENAVYVFTDWTVAAPSMGTKIDTPAGAEAFGANVSIGDFNGDGKDELVISDSLRDVEGKSNAGTVYIYDNTFGTPIELYDASPEADQRFGQAVTVAQGFDGDTLVVGANNEVFTYFRTPVSGDDDSRE